MDFGASVIEAINDSELKDIKVKRFGYNDCFVKHGNVEELEKMHKLDTKNIYDAILKFKIERC